MKKTIVSLILAAALSTSLFSSASWAAASDAGEKASAQSRLSEGEVSNGSLETDTGSLALPVDEVEEEIINHFHTNETDKLWLNEQHLPDYAMDFYSILVRESEEEHLKTDVLVRDSSFELDDEANEHVVTEVTLIEEVDYEEPFYLAAREIPVTGDTLERSPYHRRDVCDSHTGDICEADGRRNQHPRLLIGSELGDERVVRGTVKRHAEIEDRYHQEQESGVDP